MISFFNKQKKEPGKITWKNSFNDNKDWLYADIEEDFFDALNDIKRPDGAVDYEFLSTLRVAFGGGEEEKELLDKKLEKTITIAKFLRKKNIYEKTKDDGSTAFPQNRGEALRTEYYAKAMLYGEFDEEDLQKAAQDYLDYCWQDPRSKWQEPDEYDALTAVIIKLLVGDKDGALQVLLSIKKTKYYEELFSVLMVLADPKRSQQDRLSCLRSLLSKISIRGYKQPNKAGTEFAIYPFQMAWLYLQQLNPEKKVFSIFEIADIIKKHAE